MSDEIDWKALYYNEIVESTLHVKVMESHNDLLLKALEDSRREVEMLAEELKRYRTRNVYTPYIQC